MQVLFQGLAGVTGKMAQRCASGIGFGQSAALRNLCLDEDDAG